MPRRQIQPDDIGDLGDQLRIGRELERLRPPRPHPGVPPRPQYRVLRDLQLVGQQPRRPVRHPSRFGGGVKVVVMIVYRSTRRGRPGRLVLQPLDTGLGIPPAPQIHRRPGTSTNSAISTFDVPSAASNTILARVVSPTRIDVDRTIQVSTSRSPSRNPNGCARKPDPPARHRKGYWRRAALGARRSASQFAAVRRRPSGWTGSREPSGIARSARSSRLGATPSSRRTLSP